MPSEALAKEGFHAHASQHCTLRADVHVGMTIPNGQKNATGLLPSRSNFRNSLVQG